MTPSPTYAILSLLLRLGLLTLTGCVRYGLDVHSDAGQLQNDSALDLRGKDSRYASEGGSDHGGGDLRGTKDLGETFDTQDVLLCPCASSQVEWGDPCGLTGTLQRTCTDGCNWDAWSCFGDNPCTVTEPAEVSCSDTVDNDCDQKFDCGDPDCLGTLCGSGATACSGANTCDGVGGCSMNHLAAGAEGSCPTCQDCDGNGSCVNVAFHLIDIGCNNACHFCDGTGGCIELLIACYPGSGDILALNNFMMPNGELLQNIWRGSEGYSRAVPMLGNGTVDWAKASAWSSPIPLASLPGAGDFQALDGFVMPNNQLLQSLWRGNMGYARTVPMLGNGTPDWSGAGAWSSPVPIDSLPGSGDGKALDSLLMPNGELLNSFWRGSEGYSRTVPMLPNGTPDWNNASAWSSPIPLASLPGSGDYQALSCFVMPNNQVYQVISRGNSSYGRTVPMLVDGTPAWNNGSAWQNL